MNPDAPDAFDYRSFVRVDHGMPENPKVVGLSDGAFRLYVEVICWCSRQETDGRVPSAQLRRLGSRRHGDELIGAGLLDTISDEYEVHDYLHFQRSAEEIAAFRAAKGKAGALGNHQRWHIARRRRDPECEFCLKGVVAS